LKEKTFNRILSVVGIISILGFLASLIYETLNGVTLILKDFGVIWLFIYLLAITLGFKANLSAEKTSQNRSAVEWGLTCLVGLVPVAILLIYG
jgi:hypothetical protein